MALFRDRSIGDVVDHLGLVLPGDGADSLAPSAVSNARGRLGSEPVEWLFNRVASHWSNQGGERGYAGLSLFAVDGTCMRVQDSDANFEYFGKPGGRGGSGEARYPQLRLACLMNLALYHDRWEIELAYDELKTHLLDRKECLRCKSPERVAQEVWGLLLTYNLVRRDMLLIATTNDL